MKYKITILLSFLLSFGLNAQNLTGIKICVNPGHGGYDSDDRNVDTDCSLRFGRSEWVLGIAIEPG